MAAEKHGADADHRVSPVQAQALRHTQKVHADDTHKDREPDDPGVSSFEKHKPDHRHEQHVHRRDEACFPRRGGQYPRLLEEAGRTQKEAAAEPAAQRRAALRALVRRGRRRLAPSSPQDKDRNADRSGGERHARGDETEGLDRAAARALRSEGRAPDHGRKEQQETADRLLVLHLPRLLSGSIAFISFRRRNPAC